MKNLFILLLIFIPIRSLAVSTEFNQRDSTDCDLLVLQNGYYLEVEILRSDKDKVYFILCNEENSGERSFEKYKIKKITLAADRTPKVHCETLILNNGTAYDVEIINTQDSIVYFKICEREKAKIRTIHLRNIKETKAIVEKKQARKKRIRIPKPDYTGGDFHWTISFIIGLILAPIGTLILLIQEWGIFVINSIIMSFILIALSALSQIKSKYILPTLQGMILGCILGLLILIGIVFILDPYY